MAAPIQISAKCEMCSAVGEVCKSPEGTHYDSPMLLGKGSCGRERLNRKETDYGGYSETTGLQTQQGLARITYIYLCKI
jgi:hypothetical protein